MHLVMNLPVHFLPGCISHLSEYFRRFQKSFLRDQQVDISDNAFAGIGIKVVHQVRHALEKHRADAGFVKCRSDAAGLAQKSFVSIPVHTADLMQMKSKLFRQKRE